MRNEINLTGKIVRKTASATQDITEVLDVLAYDAIEFYLRVYGVEGTSPTVDITIETSMQNESDDDQLWKTLTTFDQVTASNRAVKVSATSGVLRYIRWKLTLGGSGSPAVTFGITGVGRT